MGSERSNEYATGTAVWYHAGMVPVAIRWLIRDPEVRLTPQALSAEEILRTFVRCWQMEVTFQEAHAHLGLDGQRLWSDTAIERTTPVRLALFSLVTLIANQLPLARAPSSLSGLLINRQCADCE